MKKSSNTEINGERKNFSCTSKRWIKKWKKKANRAAAAGLICSSVDKVAANIGVTERVKADVFKRKSIELRVCVGWKHVKRRGRDTLSYVCIWMCVSYVKKRAAGVSW